MPLKLTKIAPDVLTTQGDILIRDAAGYARLGYGTSGYLLKTQGIGANPYWAALVAADIPALDAAKITSGTFNQARIPWTLIPATGVIIGADVELDRASKYGTHLLHSVDDVELEYPSRLSVGTIERWESDTDTCITVNYWGYNRAFTRFRDLTIFDGKGVLLANFKGSDKTLIVYGGYLSSDGTAGKTEAVAVAKVGGGTRTLNFKNGLYVGYADS
jgi:hypothetical protein